MTLWTMRRRGWENRLDSLGSVLYKPVNLRCMKGLQAVSKRRALGVRSLELSRNRARVYFCEGLTLVKVVLNWLPTPLTAVMMATGMPAAIRPYSMAVAPDVLEERQNEALDGWFQPRFLCLGTEGSLCFIRETTVIYLRLL
jgi:hypothetical protein